MPSTEIPSHWVLPVHEVSKLKPFLVKCQRYVFAWGRQQQRQPRRSQWSQHLEFFTSKKKQQQTPLGKVFKSIRQQL